MYSIYIGSIRSYFGNNFPVLYSLILLLLFLFPGCTTSSKIGESLRPNILFIAVDDLRPELNCYGKTHIISPNLDKLAANGFQFNRAYCNIPVCGASRASLLTGLRPNPHRFLTFNTYAAKDAPNVVTLPQYFRNNGYYTLSLGKVLHHQDDSPESWSEPAWHPQMDLPPGSEWRDYQLPENRAFEQDDNPERGPAFERASVPDNAYFDGKIAQRAKDKLKSLKSGRQPFFLSVGFLKPHLPFNAPSKYWDLYDSTNISLPKFQEAPKNAPSQSMHNFGELRNYRGIPDKGPIPDSIAIQLIRGYYAAVSYADAMVGQVLDELEKLGLARNTIVVLWGDHGWSLGDHGLWCKHSTFNVALHAPLLVKVPGKEGGQQINALTEFVDIYPSLCDLAGLPKPNHLQGDSFISLLENPDHPGKEAVFCRWLNSDAVKTNEYLYTRWFNKQDSAITNMLYDHLHDTEETENIADQATQKDIIEKFDGLIKEKRSLK